MSRKIGSTFASRERARPLSLSGPVGIQRGPPARARWQRLATPPGRPSSSSREPLAGRRWRENREDQSAAAATASTARHSRPCGAARHCGNWHRSRRRSTTSRCLSGRVGQCFTTSRQGRQRRCRKWRTTMSDAKPYGIERQQWAEVVGDVLLGRGMPTEFVERVKMALDPETLMLPPDGRWRRRLACRAGRMSGSPRSTGPTTRG